jgi:arginine decarboxylase-like protein
LQRNYAWDRITFAARPLRWSRIIATTVAPPGWTIKDAEKLYNMSGWGQGYFRISPEGHVNVHPDANRKRGLDLYQLCLLLHI